MNEETAIHLTRSELRALVEDSVTETLTRLGVNAVTAEDQIEMQKDFQHLREWRETVAVVRRKGILTVVGILLAGICALVWVGLKDGFT